MITDEPDNLSDRDGPNECHDADDPIFWASRDLDGDLLPQERARLSKRLAESDDLHREAEGLCRVDRLVRRWGESGPDVDWDDFHASVLDRIEGGAVATRRLRWVVRIGVPLAAAAAIFIAVTTTMWSTSVTTSSLTRTCEVRISRPLALDGMLAGAVSDVDSLEPGGERAVQSPSTGVVRVVLAKSVAVDERPSDEKVVRRLLMAGPAGGSSGDRRAIHRTTGIF